MGTRTFFALDVDEPTRAALARAQRELASLPGWIKWVRPENLHVTMNFVGDVSDDGLAALCELAGRCAAGFEPGGFEFAARGLACVPGGGQVRMIWARVEDAGGHVARLHGVVNRALGEMGMRTESRAFRGHVTMARVRSTRDAGAVRRGVEEFQRGAFGVVRADELVLYASELSAAGPTYTALARARLGG